MTESVRDAVRRYGTQRELAAALGVTPQTVKMWVRRGFVTERYLVAFCEATLARPEDMNPLVAAALKIRPRRRPASVSQTSSD